MAFQVSPGVNVSEIDLTAVVPAGQIPPFGGIAGEFRWGPVEQRVFIDSEDRLVANFQTPNNTTADDFFTTANYLSYGNPVFVVRVVNTTDASNAITAGNSTVTLIKSEDDYENSYSSGITGVGDFVAKFPGELGNSLKFSTCPSSAAFSSTLSGTYDVSNGSRTVIQLNTVWNL